MSQINKLYFIRHGETEANYLNKVQGHLDIPLNEMGKMQASSVAKFISDWGIERIISSDLSRAWATAEIIISKIRVELKADSRLRELGFGEYEGRQWSEIVKLFPSVTNIWMNPMLNPVPSAENVLDFKKRVDAFLHDILLDDIDTAIVLHAGSLRVILASLLNISIHQAQEILLANSSISTVEVVNGIGSVIYINETRHLEGLRQ